MDSDGFLRPPRRKRQRSPDHEPDTEVGQDALRYEEAKQRKRLLKEQFVTPYGEDLSEQDMLAIQAAIAADARVQAQREEDEEKEPEPPEPFFYPVIDYVPKRNQSTSSKTEPDPSDFIGCVLKPYLEGEPHEKYFELPRHNPSCSKCVTEKVQQQSDLAIRRKQLRHRVHRVSRQPTLKNIPEETCAELYDDHMELVKAQFERYVKNPSLTKVSLCISEPLSLTRRILRKIMGILYMMISLIKFLLLMFVVFLLFMSSDDILTCIFDKLRSIDLSDY